MVDLPIWGIYVVLAIETTVWLYVLRKTGQIQRALEPIVAFVMPLLARFAQRQQQQQVPPGAQGLPFDTVSAPAASAPVIELLHTKKGQPYYRDPVTGMARFLPKGTKSVPQLAPAPAASGSPSASPSGGGGVDLNALARSFGYEPEQIAAMVNQNSSLIPAGPGGAVAPVAPGGVDPRDAMLAGLAQKFLNGDMTSADVAQNLPAILGFLRKNWKGGANSSSAAGGDGRW